MGGKTPEKRDLTTDDDATTDVYPAIDDPVQSTRADDPHNNTIPAVLGAPGTPKDWSLDDMRRLSEAIKTKRLQK